VDSGSIPRNRTALRVPSQEVLLQGDVDSRIGGLSTVCAQCCINPGQCVPVCMDYAYARGPKQRDQHCQTQKFLFGLIGQNSKKIERVYYVFPMRRSN
jgi:hypothetical protein